MAGCTTGAFAQDPSFAQFFSSPLNVNPALTARINSQWRAIANFRDQWIGPRVLTQAVPFLMIPKRLKNRCLKTQCLASEEC
jgi:hypothetical protein